MADQKWQPIETAPKDGTYVDMWCIRSNCSGEVTEVRKCNVSWGLMVDQFSGVEFEGWLGISEVYAQNTPAHWMPLPPPPQDGEA